MTLQDHRADRVAKCSGQDRRSTQQLIGPPSNVDSYERSHPRQADDEPDPLSTAGPFSGVEAQRQQRDEDRRSGDEDRRYGRADVLLAGRDQRKGQSDFGHRKSGEPHRPTPEPTQSSRTPSEPDQDGCTEHNPHPRDERGGHAVVDGDLYEQVRDPPQHGHGCECRPSSRAQERSPSTRRSRALRRSPGLMVPPVVGAGLTLSDAGSLRLSVPIVRLTMRQRWNGS
jgi:hypothetical protein